MNTKSRTYSETFRLKIIFFSFFIGFSLLFVRLVYVQILSSWYLSQIAEKQYNVKLTLPPKRGKIYDRNGVDLASSINVSSVYAEPKTIKDKRRTAYELSTILNLPQSVVSGKINNEKSFVWIKRFVLEDQAQKIRGMRNPSIGLLKEPKRFYPSSTLASHVIGFVDIDGNGLEGLELAFNDYMIGISGRQSIQRDAKRRLIPSLEYEFEPPMDGHSLVLTIDQVIQYIAEKELDLAVKQSRAQGGSIIVMNPYTGEIYAFANRPTFNLNTFYSASTDQRRNRAITDCYEPGSTFKIVTASAALNEGVVLASDKFFCENGEYKFGKRILHDHKPHGVLTVKEIIKYSSNIGVCKIAQKLGERKLDKYIKDFGFGRKTGVDMPGEVEGLVRPVSGWSRVSITSIPMGQGIAVTPMQMVCAYAAIGNGGNLVKPYVVDRIIDKKGQLIKSFGGSSSRGNVLSEKTTLIMKDFLSSVVEEGTGQEAKIDGIKVGGKTGTAQKLEPNGTYSTTKYIGSFFGFAPLDKPEVVIGVIIDEPRTSHFGGVVAAPVFQKVAKDTLRYLRLVNSRKG